jgi:uncharacterized membrane protein
MSTETDLLRSLDPEPPGPSTVDISRAIAAGRKRRTRRGVGYAGVAAVTTLVVAGTAVAVGQDRRGGLPRPATPPAASPSTSAQPKGDYTIPGTTGWAAPAATPPSSCTIEKLPVPDGVKMAIVGGGDPTGSWFVGRSYPKGGYQAVIWHAGAATKVMLPGDLEEDLEDVNAKGDAVGWSYLPNKTGDGDQVPFAYVGGKVVKLKGVTTGSANAINEAGAIAGTGGDQAVVWPSATAAPIPLPVPAGTTKSMASDIDEDGTVVGSLDLKVPYVWFADGTYRALPLPTIDGKKAVSARAFTVRNGWATGVADATVRSRAGAGKVTAVRWNVRTGEVRLDDRGWDDMADAVNAQGWAAGMIKGRDTFVAGDHKIVLPEVAEHQAGTLSTIANTISDDGKVIAGQSDDASDTIRAVVWHCQ